MTQYILCASSWLSTSLFTLVTTRWNRCYHLPSQAGDLPSVPLAPPPTCPTLLSACVLLESPDRRLRSPRMAMSLDQRLPSPRQSIPLFSALSFCSSSWSCQLSCHLYLQDQGCLHKSQVTVLSLWFLIPATSSLAGSSFIKTPQIIPIPKNSSNSAGMLSNMWLRLHSW